MRSNDTHPRYPTTTAALALAAALGCALAGCGGAELDVSDSESALWVKMSTVWPVPDVGAVTIPVCWKDSAFSKSGYGSGRELTRSAVEDAWERVANIDFVGWGRCANDSVPGIRIDVADDQPRVVGLGTSIDDSVKRGMRLNFEYQSWGSGSCSSRIGACIREHAVHEFGHALGMAHEHQRHDEPAGACDAADEGTEGDNTLGTPYDIASVMNYCVDTVDPYHANSDRLSAWDVYGTRKVYREKPTRSFVLPGGKCLDIPNDNPYDGAPVQGFMCHGGFNQQWALTSTRTLQTYGRCLDTYGSSTVYLNHCYNDAYQQLSFSNVELRGFGDLCVQGVLGASSTSGAQLEIASCFSSRLHQLIHPDQIWNYDPQTRQFKNFHGLCMDVRGGDSPPAIDTPVQAYPCHSGANQRWNLDRGGRVRSDAGHCLGLKPANGHQTLVMKSCSTVDPSWRWHLAGPMQINGKCLQLTDRSANGVSIRLKDCTLLGAADQRFDYYF